METTAKTKKILGSGTGNSGYGSLENWNSGQLSISSGRPTAPGGAVWDNSNHTRDEDSHLMAQSREQLTMDMTKSENSIFKQSKGCYVSRSKGLGLLCLTVLLAVLVGFITYHSTSNCVSTLKETSVTESPDPDHVKLEEKLKDVRLPTSVRPLYYKLDLIPYVEQEKNFTIDGKVSIDILILEDTSKISIHIKNITILEESVTVGELVGSNVDSKLSVTKHEYDEPREFYNVSLSESLKGGKTYRIFIKFTALLSDNLAGFYRSSYKDLETNGTRWLGVTQFQPTDARRAFPCFDEPALKAEFEISIARKNSMTSISNMDINRQEPVQDMDGWTWDHYNKSVPMSTYLVAFVVSDFATRQSDRSLSKPIFSVWARKDAIDQVEYARNIGPRILTFFESYFNVPFPLPKQDMIALPDFNAGAMENWGLITYRETAMLYDANVSSDYNRQRIATVIAHELAHQWFGNLVTPSWWSDLWLNEGFASYVEYIGTDHVEPEVKILEQFVVEEVQNVFALDALDSSHPISVPVHHPDEINEIFDRISYGKGASIIRMMNHFLTENSFKTGLSNYLNKWKYNSTTQDNLWDSLTEQAWADKTLDSHVTVGKIMDTWTLQKGYPVIQVDRNYPGKHANFTQMKFQLIKNETMAKEYESYRWWIPISYASKAFNSDFKKTKPEFWITQDEKFNDHGIYVNKTDWLIVNVQQTGYYRVNYDTRNWQLIIDQLNKNNSEIHTVNRAQLLDDALNLARATLLPYDLAFNVTQYLKDENEYLPWESFLNAFSYISTMLLRSPSFGLFKTYMRNLLENQYKSVGFMQQEEDQLLKRFHRINIVQWACSMDNADCVSQVKNLYSSWMKNEEPDSSNPVPTNMRSFVYCSAIRNGGEKEWTFLWERYGRSNVASEKNTILRALACTRETWILNRFLLWAITPGAGIRKQDGPSVISSVARNEIGSYLAFNFIRDKWAQIREHFPVGQFSVGGIISSISQRLTTPFELLELKNFKNKYQNDLGAATRAVDQAIERVQANIQWFADNYKVIDEWLQKVPSVEVESSTSPAV